MAIVMLGEHTSTVTALESLGGLGNTYLLWENPKGKMFSRGKSLISDLLSTEKTKVDYLA